jgi:hypothetical protein
VRRLIADIWLVPSCSSPLGAIWTQKEDLKQAGTVHNTASAVLSVQTFLILVLQSGSHCCHTHGAVTSYICFTGHWVVDSTLMVFSTTARRNGNGGAAAIGCFLAVLIVQL